jgi:hypothetical protein
MIDNGLMLNAKRNLLDNVGAEIASPIEGCLAV